MPRSHRSKAAARSKERRHSAGEGARSPAAASTQNADSTHRGQPATAEGAGEPAGSAEVLPNQNTRRWGHYWRGRRGDARQSVRLGRRLGGRRGGVAAQQGQEPRGLAAGGSFPEVPDPPPCGATVARPGRTRPRHQARGCPQGRGSGGGGRRRRRGRVERRTRGKREHARWMEQPLPPPARRRQPRLGGPARARAGVRGADAPTRSAGRWLRASCPQRPVPAAGVLPRSRLGGLDQGTVVNLRRHVEAKSPSVAIGTSTDFAKSQQVDSCFTSVGCY